MLQPTKQIPLKVYGFIVRAGHIQLSVEEKIDFTFAHTLEDAVAAVRKPYDDKAIVVSIKHGMTMNYEDLRNIMATNIVGDVKVHTVESAEPQAPKSCAISQQMSYNLDFILKDKACEQVRAKLTHRDLMDLTRIAKKL